ncbi:unknown [Clostridium sp. CAG:242]|nr:unknown [Clostridium sp. CAG:242]
MPNDTALTVALFILLLDGLDNLFDGKILLIPANLLYIGIKEHKVSDQLDDPFFAEQRNQILILLSGGAVSHILSQCSFQKSGVLFLPHIPEFFRRTGGGILHGVFIGRHHNLGKLVELRNVLLLLVADVLLHALFYADLRRFTLNDGEGNTVDKQHDIRPGIVKLVPAVYRKFFGDMKQVILWMLPVNVFQVETESFTLSYNLWIAFAQQQGIIDFFTGAHQAVGEGLIQFLHSSLDVGRGKLVFRTGEGIAVKPPQLASKNVFQQHMVPAAPLRLAVLWGNIGITHGSQQINGRLLANILF